MCVGFQIWVLVGLGACTNCNKNKLAYVVKSMKYIDKRMKYQSEICFQKKIYQSEIISELLPQITIHHIIYINIYIYIYRWDQVTPGVTPKSYTFFKPLDLSKFNGQNRLSLILIYY